jgi:hypothetical protein
VRLVVVDERRVRQRPARADQRRRPGGVTSCTTLAGSTRGSRDRSSAHSPRSTSGAAGRSSPGTSATARPVVSGSAARGPFFGVMLGALASRADAPAPPSAPASRAPAHHQRRDATLTDHAPIEADS